MLTCEVTEKIGEQLESSAMVDYIAPVVATLDKILLLENKLL